VPGSGTLGGVYDAEGHDDGPACPACGAASTWRFTYLEGFEEHECRACGWRSDEAELHALRRASGELLEGEPGRADPPIGRPLRA
jgi:Zn ribbon nucleic-acid-binding protein